MDAEQASLIKYCARHPKVETRLACGRCEKPICPRCMLQTDVGARCQECARVQKSPLVTLKPSQLAAVIAVAAVQAVGLGAAWGLLFDEVRRLWLLPWLVAIGVGYLIGEGVRWASNRKQAPELAWIAALATILAFGISVYVGVEFGNGRIELIFRDIFNIFGVALAVYMAVLRVRRF
ncbi:MAG: hypothetical protein FJ320_08870 [SAR202 cluster bacterium]|nr:hypothetical protein [SAR202 cluster bacterium]